MATVILSLKRTKSEAEYRCGVCGASFAPIEDSGSRIFSMKREGEETESAIMCGGCYSKWSAGATMTMRTGPA